MRADRFGSYSMAATLAGTPSLFRRKSTIRKRRLFPPPWWRVVILPALLRPAFLRPGANSDFSGRDLVISSNPETLAPRRPGVVGLYFRTGISRRLLRLEDLDVVALGEGDDGSLLVGPAARDVPLPLHLALAHQGVHGQDPDVPDLLNRFLDLGLVGVGADQEGVPVPLQAGVGLLGDDRPDAHVACGLHDSSPASSSSVSAPVSSAAWALAFVLWPEVAGVDRRRGSSLAGPASRPLAADPAAGPPSVAAGSLPSRTSIAARVKTTRSAARRSYTLSDGA